MNIKELEFILQKDGIIFLTYGGLFTQSLIAGMTEALEKETEQFDLNMRTSTNIFVIFIELAQNMMNYSKKVSENGNIFDPKGMIIVGKNKEEHYYVMNRNVVDIDDKEKIEPKLEKIKKSDKDELRQLYRNARKSGRDSHEKGGGIGFYEIARKAEYIEYSFTPINKTKYYFLFKAVLAK